MKKILFLLVGLLLISCNPEDIPETKGKLDPNAMIVIKPAKGVQLRSTVTGLTALEVVEQAHAITYQSHYTSNVYNDNPIITGRSFRSEDKDYEIPALLMAGIDVINIEGNYYKDFTNAFSVFITDINQDTIAYVPDAVINSARPLIEQAYNDENYTEVYRLFNEAFTFLPISE
jgi:hypothetical protein